MWQTPSIVPFPPPQSPEIGLRRLFGEVQVPVEIPGQLNGWFILDTGSYRSFVTPDAAARLRRLGVRAAPDGRLVVRSLSLGETSFHGVPLERLPAAYGQSVEDVHALGVIGMDLLSGYAVGLDVAQGTLRLFSKASAKERAAWFAKATTREAPLIEDEEGMFRTRIAIGNVSAPLLLDTGIDDTEITPVLLSRVGKKRPLPSQTERFFDRVHTVRYVEVPRLRWDGMTFSGPFRIGGVAYNVHTGFVGLALLRRTRVLIDYPGRRVYFTGGAAGAPPKWRFGNLERPRLALRRGASAGGRLRRETKGGFLVVPGCKIIVPRLWSIVSRRDGGLEILPPSRQKD